MRETYTVEIFSEAARNGFFVKWDRDTRLTDEALLKVMEKYFSGIQTEIAAVSHCGGHGRVGFDVSLPTLPMYWASECGHPPEPFVQKVLVQVNDEGFHAFEWGYATARALAVGLNVVVQESWKGRAA